MTLIYFILILGITVFVHELGHFMFAKKFKVHVYEFSIGMGPRLFKFNRKNDETTYCIRLLPIGGFVQMAGEEVEENKDVPKSKQLHSKPAYQRFLIMSAGVMMNFLTALVLLFFIGLFNTVSLNNVYVEDSLINGLNDGDKIIKVDNHFVNNYDKLALELTVASDKDFDMVVKDTSGKEKIVKVNPINIGKSYLPYGKDYGFEIDNLTIINSTNSLVKDGDEITAVNSVNVSNYNELLNELNKYDDEVTLTLKNNDITKDVTISIKALDKDASIGYSYGFYITGKEEKGFFAAIKYSFSKFISTIEQMFFTVLYLITGKISLSMLSGPVGIYKVVGVYSKYGITNLISLLCLICINVGFINFLPLPAFDGGHVLFIIIEKIKGSKVNPKVENIIHTIFFILLMILMVIITYSDIVKLF